MNVKLHQGRQAKGKIEENLHGDLSIILLDRKDRHDYIVRALSKLRPLLTDEELEAFVYGEGPMELLENLKPHQVWKAMAKFQRAGGTYQIASEHEMVLVCEGTN